MTTLSDRPPLARAGQAGVIATLIMLAVQLIWRLDNGLVQAFPEFIVAAIARLTPLSVFGAATENYGSLAKKSLFVAVLLGVVAVGYQGGRVAGWLSARWSRGAAGRLASSLVVSAALLLFTLVVIMPIAYLGVFARSSSYTSEIIVQLSVTFALWAGAWALLATPALAAAPERSADPALDRRALIGQTGLSLATIVGALTVGGASWRLLSPRKARAGAAVTDTTVQDIVATQRASQGFVQPTPTPEPEAPQESASLASDVALQEDADPFALFNQLEADGRLTTILTPTPDFYHVSKNISDPRVGKNSWSLKITGLVDKELELDYDALVARATTKKITTLCCISNFLNGDLVGTAEWQGVPLADLLTEAGVKPGAVDLKFHAADDYEDSVTIEIGMDPDNLVVVGMNGEPLEDDHGFPARLIIPAIYGMKNVKWLDRIEVVDEDFIGYWQSRGWSDDAHYQVWGRIDFPGDGDEIAPGPHVAAGVASAGDKSISRVEISLDDGETWADATLEPSLNPPITWVRWAFPFEATPGKKTMRLRATDGEGRVMDEEERQPLPDGATGWPRRRFKVED